MDCSMPGFPVLHYFLEFAQTHCPSSVDRGQTTVLPSVIHFPSCPHSFSASWSFPVIWLFESGGQRIGTSASPSFLPINVQGWFPSGLNGLIPLLSNGLFKKFFLINLFWLEDNYFTILWCFLPYIDMYCPRLTLSHLPSGLLSVFSNNTSSKASILWCSAFSMVQLWHSYMTTGKTLAWTIGAFVGKMMPLFFTMLSRFVKAFLSRSKHLLISWL